MPTSCPLITKAFLCLRCEWQPSCLKSHRSFLIFFLLPHPRILELSSLVAQSVNNLPAVLETWLQSLGQEDPLEKEMATHSSILAWRIPWTEEPGGLPSMRSQESDMTERLKREREMLCLALLHLHRSALITGALFWLLFHPPHTHEHRGHPKHPPVLALHVLPYSGGLV